MTALIRISLFPLVFVAAICCGVIVFFAVLKDFIAHGTVPFSIKGVN
jgi:hypothetical protein